ncbi:beta-N-acetylhexosaminidase [Echinicola pacifica]|uniref:beta-N-acetylhexosaminidase n=1 Tax=Echinicola pacifica TaxID=346377 RepID=A0A918UQF2_9BACT|nr:family 20 glycosylhydrolase [Echinicola pacifica]GGZ26554.1 beta-N-acetylhexosaminidase [Echinicola pacifica]
MYNKSIGLLILGMLAWSVGFGQSIPLADKYPIIPLPQSVEAREGEFTLWKNLPISVQSAGVDIRNEVAFLAEVLANHQVSESVNPSGQIILKIDTSIAAAEGYQLEISTEEIQITAAAPVGLFRGIQTLGQLIPVSANGAAPGTINLPAVAIEDYPNYAWRGMHIDVSRHFFTKDYIRKFIDRMARYHFNKLHLHLTDDQGWRIEIKQLPKLTEVGAWRTYNKHDTVCMDRAKTNADYLLDPWNIKEVDGNEVYGGFFSQEDMTMIIDYAAKHHIEVIPEIDMPGHMSAAVRAYPFLTGDQETEWGEIFSSPLNPCQESTYEFVETILDEIIMLFPSKYIHIGADEVERKFWQTANCEQWMKDHDIEDIDKLQGFFVSHMEAYVKSKGKELIVWDDALEGGISSTAHVMYWRSWVKDAPMKAVTNGNDVIMSPVGGGLYFDYAPSKSSLRKVYTTMIVPPGFSEEQANKVLGGQANIWTEYIPSERRADYMVWPRITALAERLWSAPDQYDDYIQRLNTHYSWMQAQGINYRLPDLEGISDSNMFVEPVEWTVTAPVDFLDIRYTTDGTEPTLASMKFEQGIVVDSNQEFKLAAFGPTGNRSDIYEVPFRKTSWAQPVKKSPARLTNGLHLFYHKGTYKQTALMDEHEADEVRHVNELQIPDDLGNGSFGMEFRGFIEVPDKQIYNFILTSDDGSKLYIADQEIIDNDGFHPARELSGQVALEAGLHAFELDFIEGGGGYTLRLEYIDEAGNRVPVPADWFRVEQRK